MLLDQAAAEALMKKDGCAALPCGRQEGHRPGVSGRRGEVQGRQATLPPSSPKKVKEGGSGVWGPMPMPPNATTSEADIKSLVDWILTLKK